MGQAGAIPLAPTRLTFPELELRGQRRVESELQYPGQIKVVAIREKRATDIAR